MCVRESHRSAAAEAEWREEEDEQVTISQTGRRRRKLVRSGWKAEARSPLFFRLLPDPEKIMAGAACTFDQREREQLFWNCLLAEEGSSRKKIWSRIISSHSTFLSSARRSSPGMMAYAADGQRYREGKRGRRRSRHLHIERQDWNLSLSSLSPSSSPCRRLSLLFSFCMFALLLLVLFLLQFGSTSSERENIEKQN